jgi:predicted PurR-regulated permease PerM
VFKRGTARLLGTVPPDDAGAADTTPAPEAFAAPAAPAGHAAPAPAPAPRSGRRVVQIAFEPRRLRRSVLLVLLLVSAWLVALWVFGVVGHFLFLLLLAWLLAIAMEPFIQYLMRHGMKRGGATAVTGISAILVAVILAGVFGAEFVQQLAGLVKSLPTVVTDLVEWVNTHFHTHLDPTAIVDKLNISPDQVTGIASNVAGGILGIAGSLLSVVFDLFTVIVFMFYFAGAGPRLLEGIAVWMPAERQKVMGTVWEVTANKTGGYVISKIVLAALSAGFHAIFFWIIGVPAWLPLALLVGVTAQFVPVIGTYIGVAIPVLVSVFDKPLNAVWIILFATVYQQIETYVFTPKLSKRTMDVNPAIALAAVFVGAAIWGPLGALIGIPLAAAAVALAETYGRRYELAPEVVEARSDVEPLQDDEDDGEDRPIPAGSAADSAEDR